MDIVSSISLYCEGIISIYFHRYRNLFSWYKTRNNSMFSRFILTGDCVFFELPCFCLPILDFLKWISTLHLPYFSRISSRFFFLSYIKWNDGVVCLLRSGKKSSCAISNRLSYLDYREPFKKTLCALSNSHFQSFNLCVFSISTQWFT